MGISDPENLTTKHPWQARQCDGPAHGNDREAFKITPIRIEARSEAKLEICFFIADTAADRDYYRPIRT